MERRALLVLSLLAVACGPGSYREFRDKMVDASCMWARRCGYVGAGDRAACPVEDVLVIFNDTPSNREVPGAIDVAGSISAGRMRYDSVHAQECLDAIAGAPCDDVHAVRTRGLACNDVVAANTETDRPCWTDLECTGGVCVRADGCAGTCGNYASPGAACADSADAPLAQRCDPTVGYCGPTLTGDPPTCQRKKTEGKACGENRECYFGWTCRLGKCVKPIEVKEGEPCGGDDPCKRGTYCEPSTLVCEKQHLRTESCTSPYGCKDGYACLGLIAVDPMGTPTPATTPGVCGLWLDAGATCTGDDTSVTGCPSLSQSCTGGACTQTTLRAGRKESCETRKCHDGLGCDARKQCDYLAAIFGDCDGERAALCEPGLVCTTTDAAGLPMKGTCLPPDPPACFDAGPP